MAVEAVIWDFGGVFTTSPFEAFNRLEAELGAPADHIRRVNTANPDGNAWARFEKSEIDATAFDALFLEESTALGFPIPGGAILPRLAGDLRPRMVAALDRCKAVFKVGCITNTIPLDPAAAQRASRLLPVFQRFDAVIESAKAGLRKPDPRIYLSMCEMLDVAPQACVYLDDLGINCKGAAAVGMSAIKVVDVDQTLADLAAATGLSFDVEEPA